MWETWLDTRWSMSRSHPPWTHSQNTEAAAVAEAEAPRKKKVNGKSKKRQRNVKETPKQYLNSEIEGRSMQNKDLGQKLQITQRKQELSHHSQISD